MFSFCPLMAMGDHFELQCVIRIPNISMPCALSQNKKKQEKKGGGNHQNVFSMHSKINCPRNSK